MGWITRFWNPEQDDGIVRRYGVDQLDGKIFCKAGFAGGKWGLHKMRKRLCLALSVA